MKIAVIGAGAWGTALAIALARRGTHDVRLWCLESEVVETIAARRVNELFLRDVKIPEHVIATNDIAEAVGGAEAVVTVMPSHHCRTVVRQAAPHLAPEMLVVSATKGLEGDTLLRMTQVISDEVKRGRGFAPRVGALSGPSFALEVARGDPTAIAIASHDAALSAMVQREFSDAALRIYTNDDVAGVEFGGALKNVVAIAAGVCEGLGLGHNTVAALITRGLAEITRLVMACGGRRETMLGLAGLGDLVLTCTGGLSRNRTVGVELGRGQKLGDIIAAMHGMVAEGVLTTNAAMGLALRHRVEMPIAEQMHRILHDGKPARDAIRELMARPAAAEIQN
jgi:glycerol-3-phosphate dehydrogenase (NAD(P)+)